MPDRAEQRGVRPGADADERAGIRARSGVGRPLASVVQRPLRRSRMARVIVLGGTEFIGRHLVEELAAAGDEVLVVHRGVHEPEDLVPVEHLHSTRQELVEHRRRLQAFEADAVVDMYSRDGPACQAAVDVLGPGLRWVIVSSCDVYRAFASARAGLQTDAVPLDETAVLRPLSQRFLDGAEGGENLEAEAVGETVSASVVRLGAVYGEYDPQRRHEFVLRRIRAGRNRMPIGAGAFLFSRVYAGDAARAIVAAMKSDEAVGEVFNVAERKTQGWQQWAAATVAAAGASLELVEVPDARLPGDMRITGSVAQHLLIDSSKARSVLGWAETTPDRALADSVRWHLEHPPNSDSDFAADDEALGG